MEFEFKVAMCPALTWDNTWYIFRNTKEQVEIVLNRQSNKLTSTHLLSADELNHMMTYYPNLCLTNYSIVAKHIK